MNRTEKMQAFSPIIEIEEKAWKEDEWLEKANDLLDAEPMFRQEMEDFGAFRLESYSDKPVHMVHIDDLSAISHVEDVVGLQYYSARAFTRGREGDTVVGTFKPIEGYAFYIEDSLGLGKVDYVYARPLTGSPFWDVTNALRHDPEALKCLIASKKKGIPFWLHPYMGISSVWDLARDIRDVSGEIPKVLAPFPTMTKKANDKVWFTQVVQSVLGEEWSLEAEAGSGAEEVAALLRKFAKRAPFVGLKLADSASGMGTEIFSNHELQSGSKDDVEQRIREWLCEKNWSVGDPDLSVEMWEQDRLASPSTQLWIPPWREGKPFVEGVFDQLFVSDQAHVFLGSVPSQCPREIQAKLIASSYALAFVFQQLGYTGRCSFDTIVCGESFSDATIKFVECNGRWGGTSTPMLLMNRIFGSYRSVPYFAKDIEEEKLRNCSFARFAKIFEDVLYHAGSGKGWAIVYNVACLEPTGKFDLITIGDSFEEAQQRQEEFKDLLQKRL